MISCKSPAPPAPQPAGASQPGTHKKEKNMCFLSLLLTLASPQMCTSYARHPLQPPSAERSNSSPGPAPALQRNMHHATCQSPWKVYVEHFRYFLSPRPDAVRAMVVDPQLRPWVVDLFHGLGPGRKRHRHRFAHGTRTRPTRTQRRRGAGRSHRRGGGGGGGALGDGESSGGSQ